MMMSEIDRLQRYLWESARERYNATSIPPFTFFRDPNQDAPYANYAIPDEPMTTVAPDLGERLAELQQAFIDGQRQPRFEFVEEFAPALPAALRQANYEEEGRYLFMTCTATSYRPAPIVPDLTITTLDKSASLAELRAYLTIQRQSFNLTDTAEASDEDAKSFAPLLNHGTAFLGLYQGRPVSVSMFTAPINGLIEVVGVATLPAFRRRGLGTALTDRAVALAFEAGVEMACLSAADAQAGRVYERIGFGPLATMLAYSQPV
jgi:ribosomal protein S18 acetylase RimI-like enzyme